MSRCSTALTVGVFVASLLVGCPDAIAEAPLKKRCVVVEFYHQGKRNAGNAAGAVLEELATDRTGLVVVRRDVEEQRVAQRQKAIAKYYRLTDAQLPFAYANNKVVTWKGSAKQFADDLHQALTMEVFIRPGCSHCAQAQEYLSTFMRRFPAIKIVYRDLRAERFAVPDLNKLVSKHGQAAASVPVFHACNQLLVGFDRASTTGPRLEKIFERWTTPCATNIDATQTDSNNATSATRKTTSWSPAHIFFLPTSLFGLVQADARDNGVPKELPLPIADSPQLELPLPGYDLPDDGTSPSTALPSSAASDQQRVDLPVFGQLDAHHTGLPLFTLAIGLVDGFNPCAMWVLLFLLSLLVNLRDRGRIIAVAGSFVIVSGLAYFAFMAAWLNVFLLIGLLRPVQITLGLLGIVVGSIHVKDFFAFKKGISLSIPESAKPGIYARTRAIITAETLTGAVLGAITLAVLVNIVELLCTAGLPALYTEVLASYQLPWWKNYAYLGLYIGAYMLDDSIMVAIVVLTLSKRKLQETQGRLLKLVSGTVIMALGFVVLFQPDWLM